MDEVSIGYYQRREAREQQLAAGARDPDIAAIHRELAEQYRRRIAEATTLARV